MPFEYQAWITRADLRANRDKIYLFGDNAMRYGLGGQAREMRGERNALGVATKWAPGIDDSDYFDEGDKRAEEILLHDLRQVANHYNQGTTIIVPANGLGTGLSQLPERAPSLARLIDDFFKAFGDVPWLTSSSKP